MKTRILFCWAAVACCASVCADESAVDRRAEGQRLIRAGQAEEAVACFAPAAQQGDAVAQRCYGICLLKGIGLPQDVAAGIGWLEKAAEQGNAEARAAPERLARLQSEARQGEADEDEVGEAADGED